MSKYTKPPELRAEWDALGTPADPGFYDRLAEQRIETVVTACRVYGREGGDRLFQLLIDRVTPRFEAVVRRVAAEKADVLSLFHQQEAEEAVAQAFWETVLTSESFFEIRFNKALLLLARTAYRDTLESKQRTRERMAQRIVAPGDEDATQPWATDVDHLPAGFKDETEAVDGAIIADAVLAQLDDELAQAITLHVRMDLKIFSTNPAEVTVASTLDCGERKARQLVADGFARLREIAGNEEGHG